jgi:hypothetical protein
MTSPSRKALADVFDALVGNGFDFFERSAKELDKDQKFSIVHFATGLELLLKSRLFHEHWTLIATDPHKCAWTGVKDGTLETVKASSLCSAISTTVGTSLKHERDAFKKVFDHRNRVLHFAPPSDLEATVAEQCLAWHHLRMLLTGQWKEAFALFLPRIENVDRELRAHRTYLEVRFQQSEAPLKKFEAGDRVLLCPTCGFRAGVAEVSPNRVLAFNCLVCGDAASAARVSCGALFALDTLPADACDCRETHDRQELMDELDPPSPDEDLDRGYCGECFEYEHTVVSDGETFVCVCCGSRFQPETATSCECCNERWIGWDSEASSYTGCDRCGGRDIDDD